jgi:hypothetical protein
MTPAAECGKSAASLLERMIARLVAQRACLEAAATLISDVPGPVLELGLGKGRTYDHLRCLFPDREIFAFDRHVHAPAGYVPDPAHLLLGDLRATLPRARELIGVPAALVHADIGTDDAQADAALAAALAPLIDRLLSPRGIILSDRAMQQARWASLPLPDEAHWPYYMYQVSAG